MYSVYTPIHYVMIEKFGPCDEESLSGEVGNKRGKIMRRKKNCLISYRESRFEYILTTEKI